MKTQVFAHRGIIVILSAPDAEGVLINPFGYVVDAKFVEMSTDAIEALKTIKTSSDDIGDIDIFKADDGSIIFSWLGESTSVISPAASTGSRTYNANLLSNVVTIVPNNPPSDFVRAIDGYFDKN